MFRNSGNRRGPSTPDEQGLSLEELSASFARLLGANERQRDESALQADDPNQESGSPELVAVERPDSDACPVSPQNIVEAILFLGHPHDEPISSRTVASLIRGVNSTEVEAIIAELNSQYELRGCPYVIESVARGFRMVLRREFENTRNRFYGKIRETQLSQAAINTLAIVAYHQPIRKQQILAIAGDPSTSRILSQLVRRGLVRLEDLTEPTQGSSAKPKAEAFQYVTTERFLDIFGLISLEDLPRDQHTGNPPAGTSFSQS